MTLPRQVIPGRFYMITRRCTQRQFLLRPDDEMNNAFTYCLADAVRRTKVEVLLPSQMSNHHHTIIYDRYGTVNDLTEHFHKMLARCGNALRGRWENFWSSGQVSIVHLADREAVIEELVYAATNPVKDGLVERVRHWPGVNGLDALLNGAQLCAQRPRHFFRENGPMPKRIELRLAIPHELGDREEILREIRERVAAVEDEHDRLRAKTGRRVLGRRAILKQSWSASPTSIEQRRTIFPRVAAGSSDVRRKEIGRYRDFVTAYRKARRAYQTPSKIPFPIGTYWLRRFVGVPIVIETA